MKSVTRVNGPALLVPDLSQAGVAHVSASLGASPQEAKQIGASAGLIPSAAMGVACGGFIGALVGVGLWVLGELLSSDS